MELVKTVTRRYKKWEFYKHDNGLYTVRYAELRGTIWSYPFKNLDDKDYYVKECIEAEYGVKL